MCFTRESRVSNPAWTGAWTEQSCMISLPLLLIELLWVFYHAFGNNEIGIQWILQEKLQLKDLEFADDFCDQQHSQQTPGIRQSTSPLHLGIGWSWRISQDDLWRGRGHEGDKSASDDGNGDGSDTPIKNLQAISKCKGYRILFLILNCPGWNPQEAQKRPGSPEEKH